MSTTANATVTLYAQWKSASVVLPNATKAGAVIDGWYAGGVKVGEPGDSYTPTANVTLTAKWIEKYTPEITGNNYTLLVEGEQANAFSFKYTDNPTEHIEVVSISEVNDGTGKVISYDAKNNKIIAHNAGEATIYLSQPETETIKAGNSAKYTVVVTKFNNTLAIASTSYTKYVDEEITNIISSMNSDAAVTTSSSDATIAYYDVPTDKIVIPNSEAKSFSSQVITITIAQAETYKYTAAEKTIALTINKYTPTFTWNAGNAIYYYGTSIPNIFSTTNPDVEVTFTSNNEAFARVESNTLYIANLNETATITVNQKENYKWNGQHAEYFISPVNGNKHVPFEIKDESKYNLFRYNESGTVSWSEGVKFSQGKAGWNWDDSYYDIQFEGIPDRLTFDFDADDAATGEEWYVQESNDGVNWSSNKLCVSEANSGSASATLQSSTRFLRFCYSGNLNASIKNIIVTERFQFEATPLALDFGTNGINHGKQDETVTFLHANAGRITEAVIEGTDAEYFSVTPEIIAGTGRDMYGTARLQVSFDNRGENRGKTPYNAVLVICDNANGRIEIPLTGVRDGQSTPEFIWNPNTLPYYFNTTIANIAFSTNKDANCPLSYVSTDESIAKVVKGDLYIYGKGQEVTITVSQAGNADYIAHSEKFTFTPYEKPSLEVPFQVSWNLHKTSIQFGSKCEMVDDAQIEIGDPNLGGFTWGSETKRVLVTFAGIPDKLSFDYKFNSVSNITPATPENAQYAWYVEESPNGVDWTYCWHTSTLLEDWKSSGEIPLKTNTQYVRIEYKGNFAGYIKNINISALDGYNYLRAEEGIYLSRGAKYGTQAVVDPFGVVCRVTRYTIDNVNHYSRFQFVDNMQYLWETHDTKELFTDDKTAANTDNLWKKVSDASGKFTIQSGNDLGNKGQYVTIDNNALTLTTDANQATIWHMETPSEHDLVIKNYMDDAAAWAASKDFGAEVNTLEKVRSNIDIQDFEVTEIVVPGVTLSQQNGEYRDGINGTFAAYDNTIEGLEPGFYRLTVRAFYRIAESQYAQEAHKNDWESVIAYIYANQVKYPIQSVFDSYNAGSYDTSDELFANHYYPTKLQPSVEKAFKESNRYLNDVYVYVEADEGKTTGTLHYGIKNPSFVPGAWLAYSDIHLTRFARKEYIFECDDSQSPGDWNISNNWNREAVPNKYHRVTIKSNANIALPFEVYSLSIDAGKTVHITSEGGMTIGNGGVLNAEDGAIVVDNTPKGAGFLRIDPNTVYKLNNKVEVKYTTKAYDGVWQYFGAPGEDAVISSEPYTDVYLWSEPQGWLQHHSQALQPFEGYAITQYNGENQTYSMSATPVCLDKTITLTKTAGGMNGDNLFVNSYLAPIDLTKFTDFDDELNNPNDDFRGDFEKTFYLFNSGSWEDWQGNGGSNNNGFVAGNERGQYFAITPLSVKLLDSNIEQTVIPSMQGVYVIAKDNGASIKLNYNKHVYKAEATNMNQHMRAPKILDEDFMRVRMQVGSQNCGSDRLYVIQYEAGTQGFDNGYDARNILAEGLANIYTSEQDGQMEISVSNKIDETYIGFAAGNDTQYTLRFTSVVGELYLKDLETGTVLAVIDGEEYAFYAAPNSVNDRRFLLFDHMPEQGGVSTDVENLSSAKVWISDNMVHVTNAPINSEMVIYTISGVVVTSFVTTTTYVTMDMANLPTGVYMLRMNDKVYKFVCK